MSAQHAPTRIGFDAAVAAIKAGAAVAGELWLILADERDRDGYWLRPGPWEGAGEYQRVEYADGRRDCLVRLPRGEHALPRAVLASSGAAQ